MIRRTSSGLVRIRIEVTIELMHDDLPAPVAPAISMWGSSERLSIWGRSADVDPQADLEGWVAPAASRAAEDVTERHQPALAVGHLDADGAPPGMGASNRTSGVARA